MKKIHFHNFRNWIWISILILSMILILMGTFEVFELENLKLNKKIRMAGYLLYIFYYSKTFWFKNYVEWNKKEVHIRINSFLGKSLLFDHIKATEFKEDKLVITTIDGKELSIDLTQIIESDKEKLNELLTKNTIVNTA